MLPVTHGVRTTGIHILIYTLILVPITTMPYFIGMSGVLYLIAALLLGAYFFFLCIELLRGHNPKTAINMFRYSITYLGLLFCALLVDHYVVI